MWGQYNIIYDDYDGSGGLAAGDDDGAERRYSICELTHFQGECFVPCRATKNIFNSQYEAKQPASQPSSQPVGYRVIQPRPPVKVRPWVEVVTEKKATVLNNQRKEEVDSLENFAYLVCLLVGETTEVHRVNTVYSVVDRRHSTQPAAGQHAGCANKSARAVRKLIW